jgi:hypothetical protein
MPNVQNDAATPAKSAAISLTRKNVQVLPAGVPTSSVFDPLSRDRTMKTNIHASLISGFSSLFGAGVLTLVLTTAAFAIDTADSVVSGASGGSTVGGGLLQRKQHPISQGTPIVDDEVPVPARPGTPAPPVTEDGPTSRPA